MQDRLCSMRFASFTHLHVHSDFSLLGAAATVSSLIDKAALLQQPAIALTDYANLFGAVEFYSAAVKKGLKPVMGLEVNLCPNYQVKKNEGGRRQPNYPSLVLLARTNHGWENLLKLVSISWLEGFYYKPRVDHALLKEYSEGLIALSSGWNGEIEQLLRKGNEPAAYSVAQEYMSIFAQDCFFIELQRTGIQGQDLLNQQLIDIAHELHIPLVASNDVHFLARDDFEAYQAMQALQQNRTMNDEFHGHVNAECYLKSYEEMQVLFADIPEAIENSMHIACRCNVDMQFGQYQLPHFEVPGDTDLQTHMRILSHERLTAYWPRIMQQRPDAVRQDYMARLDFELDIICKMGFPGYFLIVADFIQWARDQDIPVGPGRGSGAGSLVAFVLGITDLDPLYYNLLFERFLNPERVSMPDFDIDFCMDRRDEVIQYVAKKYGQDHVAQIITYGSMKAKAVVRDVGRVLDIPYADVDVIAKLIPADMNMTLDKALDVEPELSKIIEKDPRITRLFEIAGKLEGLHRHAGKHAAGVVIGRTPLTNIAPLYRDPREGSVMVQWDMKSAEKVGLVKFDFLGLKTLTVIHKAEKLLHLHGQSEEEKTFNITQIPLDDEATYTLLKKGLTGAVFQLESSGMRDLLTRLLPSRFEDVIALVALYRPGPLKSGMVDDFIERKHGRDEVSYVLPQLKPILDETYGVILYQEQVMKIAQVLAGYSLGQADMLRRAMGKKKPEEMAQQRSIFMAGAADQHIDANKAEYIFDLMEKFAGYGFNKSHSAAYALIAYQTAYLKAHYPLALMAASISCDMGNTDKVVMLIQDCQQMGIEILPPSVQLSYWEFVPEGKAIRYGLGAIKGVGQAAIESLTAARQRGQMFQSFSEMLERVAEKTLNKRVLEALIKSGSCNGLIPHQRVAIESLSSLISDARRRQGEESSHQMQLFSTAAFETEREWPELEAWNAGEVLQHEKDVLGFYLTGHPLEASLQHIEGLANTDLASLTQCNDGQSIVFPATVKNVRVHHGNRGTMAFVRIEDLHGEADLVCFSKMYQKNIDLLNSEDLLLISAQVDLSRDEPSLLARHMVRLDDILPQLVNRLILSTTEFAWEDKRLEKVNDIVASSPGESALALHVRLGNGCLVEMQTSRTLTWNDTVTRALEELFGHDVLRVICHIWQPEEIKRDTT
ncbi:MAG: DNA polymerase III subunit alpha [Mariprofundaceae bacterium]|nr:DNA polymerase III subunit alpha [Mariprofundaceae bacterium]